MILVPDIPTQWANMSSKLIGDIVVKKKILGLNIASQQKTAGYGFQASSELKAQGSKKNHDSAALSFQL